MRTTGILLQVLLQVLWCYQKLVMTVISSWWANMFYLNKAASDIVIIYDKLKTSVFRQHRMSQKLYNLYSEFSYKTWTEFRSDINFSGATTLSIMTFSILTVSIKGLLVTLSKKMTLSKKCFAITLRVIMLSIALYILLCWMSLCWVSLCLMSWHHFSCLFFALINTLSIGGCSVWQSGCQPW